MPFHDKKLYFVEQLTINIGVIMDTVLCKDCKHSFRTGDILSLLFRGSRFDYKCRKAFTETSNTDLVMGGTTISTEYKQCSEFRLDIPPLNYCGQAGTFWEPKHKKDLFKFIIHIGNLDKKD